MRDTVLVLMHDSGATDRIRFTVIWATVTTKHGGFVSDDNAAKPEFADLMSPPSSALGYQFQIRRGPSGYAADSIGSEFIGHVDPINLIPEQLGAALRMNREVVIGKHWGGMNGDGTDAFTDLPPTNDISPDKFRDDNPRSFGSLGKIYDVDGPGVFATLVKDLGWVVRLRANFRAWVECLIGPFWIRCSEKKGWYTRQSYEMTANLSFGVATGAGANSLSDASQNWIANQWANGAVRINAGPGAGEVGRILSNTQTTLTVQNNWTVQPIANQSAYTIVERGTWVRRDEIPNDNQNGDGATSLDWNLA
jgi:hypothetical protein